jgi:hypothetical protein
MNKAFIIVLSIGGLFASVAAAAGTAATPGQDSFSLELRGYVPVICRATVSASQVGTQADQVSLGKLDEFCNDPNGYQVWVDYSPELADAAIEVDGRRVALNSAGSTLISSASQPQVAGHDLALDLPTNGVQGSLSIRVVAL